MRREWPAGGGVARRHSRRQRHPEPADAGRHRRRYRVLTFRRAAPLCAGEEEPGEIRLAVARRNASMRRVVFMSLTRTERERISDDRLKIQAVAESLKKMDPRKV